MLTRILITKQITMHTYT